MALTNNYYNWNNAASIRGMLELDYSAADVTVSTLTSGVANITRAFWVKTAGDLVVRLDGMDSDTTIPAAMLVVGMVYPTNIKIVRKIGSTAAGFFVF